MSQSVFTHQILRWIVISLITGAGIGLICGVILLIRQHFLPAINSVTVPEDLIGQIAVVTLPFGPSQTGQVRIAFQGQTFERQARSYCDKDDVTDFKVGDVVLVVDIDGDRVVWVIPDLARVYTVTEAS